MKQLLFMLALTAIGAIGAFTVEPFVGVVVYYLFAVLRPQYLWEWSLPPGVGWSGYVAWATLAATVWFAMSDQARLDKSGAGSFKFAAAHKAFFAFGAWICLTYVTALDQTVAWPWFLEYLKLFLMFGVAAYVLRNARHVWWIFALSTVALIYIAYEVNYLYFVNGRVDIYNRGYGGLDNNGAGLMLAMGVPLALNAWEGAKVRWRWLFLAGIPLLIHAVLMSYSRGAMVSLIAATPLIFLRSQRKRSFGLAMIALVALVPYLAGNEIRERFFSTQDYVTDESANSRFESWKAAVRIANDYPVFGVGVRNSNQLSFQYGADVEGRTIHSQYLQILADTGYPGLILYLGALAAVWLSMRKARRHLKRVNDDESRLYISILNGVEGSLFVFCFGALFLSLEVFELPYLVALLGAQVGLLSRRAASVVPVPSMPAHVPVGMRIPAA